jgi:hypothetical protein
MDRSILEQATMPTGAAPIVDRPVLSPYKYQHHPQTSPEKYPSLPKARKIKQEQNALYQPSRIKAHPDRLVDRPYSKLN